MCPTSHSNPVFVHHKTRTNNISNIKTRLFAVRLGLLTSPRATIIQPSVELNFAHLSLPRGKGRNGLRSFTLLSFWRKHKLVFTIAFHKRHDYWLHPFVLINDIIYV